ncbi:MAG TPA: hypothetical protein VES00_05495 [Burkholderiaceae bacterium]|jgi:hypothetical protein|nr:hypothetical protein [Burkholderiaceae bacterium]
MTTYVLSLTGDEEKAANATHWARFRKAKLLSVSRKPAERSAADRAGKDSIVILERGSTHPLEPQRRPGTHDPEALAALLVRTLDIQDGTGVVLADFDNEEFAADVVARIAALGRDVTCTGRIADFAFGLGVRGRFSRA